jgi:hypothetical protein
MVFPDFSDLKPARFHDPGYAAPLAVPDLHHQISAVFKM